MRIVLESPRFTLGIQGINGTCSNNLNNVKNHYQPQQTHKFLDMIEDMDIKSSAREDYEII